MRKGIIILLALLATGCGSRYCAVTEDDSFEISFGPYETPQEVSFPRLIRHQRELQEVAYPILAEAAGLREETKVAYGFFVHDSNFYAEHLNPKLIGTASWHLGIEDFPTVAFVHPSFPASNSGLMEGDRLLSIRGRNVQHLCAVKIMKLLDRLGSEPIKTIDVAVERQGRVLTFPIHGRPTLGIEVRYLDHPFLLAGVEAGQIEVSRGLLDHSETVAERALLFATLVADTLLEDESPALADVDRLALLLVDRSGLSIQEASTYWKELAAHGRQLEIMDLMQRYPVTFERLSKIDRAVKEIEQSHRRGLPILWPWTASEADLESESLSN